MDFTDIIKFFNGKYKLKKYLNISSSCLEAVGYHLCSLLSFDCFRNGGKTQCDADFGTRQEFSKDGHDVDSK